MNFTVEYRDAHGRKISEVIAAENRAAAYALLSKRGIRPISLSEGGQCATSPKEKGRSAQIQKRLVAGLVLVILCGVGSWYLFRSAAVPEAQKTKTQGEAPRAKRETPLKTVAGEQRPAVAVPKTNVLSNVSEKPSQPVPEKNQWLGQDIDHKDVKTNGSFVVETIYTVDGRVHKYFHDAGPKIFDSASDQILALATQGGKGGAVPPIPVSGGFSADFAASLKKEIVINEDDPSDVKALKQRVKQAREDMVQMMKDGLTPAQILQEHQKLQRENSRTRSELVEDLRKYVDAGDVKGAQMFCRKVNPTLEEMGIMPLELPRSQDEIRAERMRRSAAASNDDQGAKNE